MSSQMREVAITIRMTWYFRRFETRVKNMGFIVTLPAIDELLIYSNMLTSIQYNTISFIEDDKNKDRIIEGHLN